MTLSAISWNAWTLCSRLNRACSSILCRSSRCGSSTQCKNSESTSIELNSSRILARKWENWAWNLKKSRSTGLSPFFWTFRSKVKRCTGSARDSLRCSKLEKYPQRTANYSFQAALKSRANQAQYDTVFNLVIALLQRLLKNEYFGLEDLSGMSYLLGGLLFKYPEKFLTWIDLRVSCTTGLKLF